MRIVREFYKISLQVGADLKIDHKLLKNSNCPKFNFHPFGGEKEVEPNQIHLNFKPLGLTDMCGTIAVA